MENQKFVKRKDKTPENWKKAHWLMNTTVNLSVLIVKALKTSKVIQKDQLPAIWLKNWVKIIWKKIVLFQKRFFLYRLPNKLSRRSLIASPKAASMVLPQEPNPSPIVNNGCPRFIIGVKFAEKPCSYLEMRFVLLHKVRELLHHDFA